MEHTYNRIVVHTDFDGLISALLLRRLYGPLEVIFVNPRSVETKAFQSTPQDIIADLPWPGAGLWFDHHATNEPNASKGIFDKNAPSAPRVIYEHCKSEHPELNEYMDILLAADKIDFARYNEEDVRHPDRWIQLGYTLDFGEKIEDDTYRMHVLNLLETQNYEKLFLDEWVQRRIKQYQINLENWRNQIRPRISHHGKALLVDLTHDENFPRGNNFELYIMYPDHIVTVTVYHSKHEQNHYKISCGNNIFCKDKNKVHLGELMKKYGGGGHRYAAGCTIPFSEKDRVVQEVLEALNA